MCGADKKNIGYFTLCLYMCVCLDCLSLYAKHEGKKIKRKFIRLCQSSKDLWHSKHTSYVFNSWQWMKQQKIKIRIGMKFATWWKYRNKKKMKKNSRNLIEKYSMRYSFGKALAFHPRGWWGSWIRILNCWK